MDIRWAKARSGTGTADYDVAQRLAIGNERPSCVFVFASASCDLDALATELAALDVPTVACTSAGQIGAAGFEAGDLTAAAVIDELEVRSFPIRSLTDMETSIDEMAAAVTASGILDEEAGSVFGLVLVDGLALAEEKLMSSIHWRLPRLPIAGGSAGDDLKFERTQVYFEGAFHTDAAVLHIFRSPHKVARLKLQHHVPTHHRLIVTGATPGNRTVIELNGMPAAEAYAAAIGVPLDKLDEATIAKHPLMVRLGDDYFIRSVRNVREDGALELFCAIEQGLVLRLGKSERIVETLDSAFAHARAEVGDPLLVIGCDCILRRLEVERAHLTAEVGDVFAANRVIGFSTYGEQYNALHANQTFTGFMIGAQR